MPKNNNSDTNLTNSESQVSTGTRIMKSVSSNRSLIILVSSIFFAEFAIMLVFLILPPLPPLLETFVDSAALILIVSPIVYRFAIIPLDEQIAKTNDANYQLEATNKNIKEHTAELESANLQITRRAAQLQAVTELSEAIAQLHNLDSVFSTATSLINERFGFYHVGIFIVDKDREYAIIQASNSEGGKYMLERGHKLKLGTGVVGYAAQTGQPRIALDVGADAVFFDNPNLPNTRSEVALPMKLRGETIGVLDVQSTEAGAFTNEDLQVLTALANQVTIAMENARLLTEARAALTQVQEIYREYTSVEWSRVINAVTHKGFRYTPGKIEQLNENLDQPEVRAALESGAAAANQMQTSRLKRAAIAVPVKLRGETIGILQVEAEDPSRQWGKDDITLVEAVAERAALAMENARLFQDARRRASKERAISEATTRISGALNIENILQATAEEVERVLGGSEVVIQFQSKESK